MEATGQDLGGMNPSEPDDDVRAKRTRQSVISQQGVRRGDDSSKSQAASGERISQDRGSEQP
jgi:hypothetical protein